MGILDSISKPTDRPVIVTLCGDSGMGKTTLAASFPKPIVIRAEDGIQAVPVNLRPDVFPVINEVDELWNQLKGLINEEHSYQTLVIDSITALERMFVQYVVDTDPKKPKGIQQALGGYGAGREAVAVMHQRLRKAASILAEKRGMHTVFIAHVEIGTENPPDDDSFSKYGLRLHAKSMAPYVDDVDVVGFLKLETYTTGEGERKKAVSDGTRVLITYATAANVSKNRYGITEPLTVIAGNNPLEDYIPALKGAVNVKKEKNNG
jgi:hypothetical protein